MAYQPMNDQSTTPIMQQQQPSPIVYQQPQPVYVVAVPPPTYNAAVMGQQTEGQLNMQPNGMAYQSPQYQQQPQQPMYAPQQNGASGYPGNYQQPQHYQGQAVSGSYQNPNAPQVVVIGQNSGLSEAATIMTSGLCSCFDDIPTCLGAYFCPWCMVGYNASRVNLGNGVLYCCCYFLFPCCVGAHVHSQLSVLSGAGDPGFCAGCCLHIWCNCCAIAQEGRAANKLFETGMVMSRA